MKPWYKYLPLKYANALTERGLIKIGTLFEYQKEDQYGKNIGDKGEGSLTEWSRISRENVTQKDLNRIERQVFKIGNGVKGAALHNCLAAVTQNSRDLYIYSVSRVFNIELLRTLCEDYHEKYDSCVRINNPEKFIKAVSDAFSDKGKFEATALCCYMSRTKHHSKSVPHPVFIKEPHYQYQEEIRTVWSPVTEETIQGEIIEIPNLSNYCELYFVDTGDRTEDGMSMVKNKKFENDVVKIDSSVYLNCNFRNTEILFCAEDVVYLNTCEFHNCIWTLEVDK